MDMGRSEELLRGIARGTNAMSVTEAFVERLGVARVLDKFVNNFLVV